MKRTLAAFAVVVLASAAGVPAHEGHAHKVMGTVTMIDANQIEVETKEGKKEPFLLTKETKYLKGKKPAVSADVKVGGRVVVSVVEKDGKKLATEVLVGEAKGSEAHPGSY